jgi:hypothetical protein
MVANLVVLIMDLVVGLPMIYRMIPLPPSVALTNIVACRVFRHTKLGRKRDDEDVHAVSTLMFRRSNTAPVFVHSQMSGSAIHTSSIIESDFPSNTHFPSEKLRHSSKKLFQWFSRSTVEVK